MNRYFSFVASFLLFFGCKSINTKNKGENSFIVSSKQFAPNTCDSLLAIFPASEMEYLEFYNLTENKNSNKIFLDRYERIKRAAYSDSCGTLKNFLFISQFVDGEFAESYYDDATFIIDNNSEKFCELFAKYGLKELSRLKEEFDNNCK